MHATRPGVITVVAASAVLPLIVAAGLLLSLRRAHAGSPDPSATATPSAVTATQDDAPQTFVVGNPALVNGEVVVTVSTAGKAASYRGFNLHLRWAPHVFALASATATGGIFDEENNTDGGVMCVGPTDALDADGGGTVVGCTFLGMHSTSATGVLATITLRPRASGCSSMHLVRVGPSDNAGSTGGSYLIDAIRYEPEVEQYNDGSASDQGRSCS